VRKNTSKKINAGGAKPPNPGGDTLRIAPYYVKEPDAQRRILDFFGNSRKGMDDRAA
jgi:hypothetical protein